MKKFIVNVILLTLVMVLLLCNMADKKPTKSPPNLEVVVCTDATEYAVNKITTDTRVFEIKEVEND